MILFILLIVYSSIGFGNTATQDDAETAKIKQHSSNNVGINWHYRENVEVLQEHARSGKSVMSSENDRRGFSDFEDSISQFKKWPAHMNNELAKLWHECIPHIKGHSRRVYKRWRELHPDYAQLSVASLDRRASRLAARVVQNSVESKGAKLKRRHNYRWTKELDTELLEIWKKTCSQGKLCKDGLYRTWLKNHPEMFLISKRNLFERAGRLIERSKRINPAGQYEVVDEDKYPQQGIMWPAHINADLEKVWYRCKPRTEGHNERVYRHWCELHPDYAGVPIDNLMARARRLLARKYDVSFGPVNGVESIRQRRIFWTNKLDEDLLEISRSVPRGKVGYRKQMHTLWTEKHPELSFIPLRSLTSRLNKLKPASLPSNNNRDQGGVAEDFISSSSNHENLVSHHCDASNSRQHPESPPGLP